MPGVLGIDLGTTNSAAAVMEHDAPMVVPMQQGKLTMPSVVAFVDGQRLVGESAKRQFVNNPENTIFAVKRLIGRAFDDAQTQKAIEAVGYNCVRGPHGDVWVSTNDQTYAIPEISALILGEIKEAARQHFSEEIVDAVITVPAYFNDRQRHATKQAAQIAGLNVLRVVNEPTAAALAYGMHQGGERRVAVYDLGGGTFDVSVLKVGGGAVEVLASDGDAFLGGHDFDNKIFSWLVEHIDEQHGTNVRSDMKASQRLREASEAAKIRLSDEEVTNIALPFLTSGPGGESVHFEGELTREEFEKLTEELVDKTKQTFIRTIEAAGLEAKDIDEVLLVGGMSFAPAVRRCVQEVANCEPATGVHPDLVVAVGAAAQAALMTDDSQSAVLLDVTPHNLGILIMANLAETIIPKNTKVPATGTRRFVTVSDNQATVRIVAFQGDDRHIDKNEILGEFVLKNLRAASAGEVEIDVSFNISAEGIVQIKAIDTHTGVAQEISISDAVGIGDKDLERMIESHKDEASS